MIAITRLLGLFMLLPVLSIWAAELDGATPLLIGLAVGGYGLTQALLQIPFGRASDRLGRRRVVIAGLALFVLGSICCALSQQIEVLVAGRILQGTGAVSAAIAAWVADVSPREIRVRATAILGASIGSAYVLSLMVGPALASWLSVSGVFWLSALLGLIGMALAATSREEPITKVAETVQFSMLLRTPGLLRIAASVYLLHTVLIAFFIIMPFALSRSAGLVPERQWLVYLIAVLASLVVVLPLLRRTERATKLKIPMLPWLLVAAGLAMLVPDTMSLAYVSVAATLFFAGFNTLEASLPALVSLVAPEAQRGSAMGAYTTAHFLGAFSGGLLGGLMLPLASNASQFAALGVLALTGLALGLRPVESPDAQKERL